MYLNAGVDTTAAREWQDPSTAPGGDVARLRAVRVRSEDGKDFGELSRAVTETVDIRKPVGIEMEFEVLQPDRILLPHFHFINEDGVNAFESYDLDPAWQRRPRPPGRYVSTAWIPGNFLSEGMIYVEAVMITLDPVTPQFWERSAVAFRVIDPMEGDSARGDWVGRMESVVRPKLEWTTTFTPAGSEDDGLVE